MPSVAVTSTAAAAVGPLHSVKAASHSRAAARTEACMIRPQKGSACNKTCAIVLGCLLGACFLIALFVLLWCRLAARRRREQRRSVEEDAYWKKQPYTGEEEAGATKNISEVPTSTMAERDALPSFLSTNPLSAASLYSRGTVAHVLSSRIQIGEDEVMPLSQSRRNPLAPQAEAPQLGDAPQEEEAMKPKRSTRSWRVRGRERSRGVSMAAFEDDSVSSIDDDLV
ncbi:hypothetical protein conserved [Leishmania donovani]|uniref:Hypothetical_protein_conserved n=1 Tax=Leishmania donovani TaxID=5661 RepID=A0A504Y3Z7_LEIDO|nr:hypothetical protein CGC20_9950 [Leishmania donovani]CAJ1992292.1 hypothetical protein conserved [Leishmania donovani]VDZ48127.1 hypothetical_protein_conserved [Leishmania donovani]